MPATSADSHILNGDPLRSQSRCLVVGHTRGELPCQSKYVGHPGVPVTNTTVVVFSATINMRINFTKNLLPELEYVMKFLPICYVLCI